MGADPETSSSLTPAGSKEKKRGGIVQGVIIGALGTIVAGILISNTEEDIERPAAEQFLRDYFATAPRYPQQTWDDGLTSEFQASRSLNFEEYKEFFDDYRTIDVTTVTKTPFTKNYFTANLRYIKADGRFTEEQVNYGLECFLLQSYTPLLSCDASDLKIYDSAKPDTPRE